MLFLYYFIYLDSNGTPQIVTEDQRKPVIPLWAEWSDQDISNEKWVS